MAIRRHYNNNAAVVSTVGSMSNVATTVTVSDASTFPASYPWTAIIDASLPTAEVVLVTAATGALLTITRGYDGTAAQTHASAATFAHVAVQADYDEANSHVVASAGVHGVSGTLVGTTDVQTLTNKTVASPTLTGTAAGVNATLSGTLTVTGVAALNGGVTTSTTVTATGAVTGGSLVTGGAVTATGAATAASFTANGNGVVSGVVVPKSYGTEALATAALPSPATNTLVWLTAPTGGGPAGLYYWTGAAWATVAPGFLYGDSADVTAVTLTTAATNLAGSASVTFKLPVQRRVRVVTTCRYALGTTTNGRCQLIPGYNTGASPVIGSVVQLTNGQFHIPNFSATAGANGAQSGMTEATVLLAAGQYTAYGVVSRASGGAASDVAAVFYTAVYDAGAA